MLTVFIQLPLFIREIFVIINFILLTTNLDKLNNLAKNAFKIISSYYGLLV